MGRSVSRLVLASGSPQRRAILGDLGLDFEVRVSDVAEQDAGAPRAVAAENARRKALAVASDGELVVGCDTLVATGERIWGKPPDEAAARVTLRHLSGRTHEVVSGLALVQDGELREATEVTHVTFASSRANDRLVPVDARVGGPRGRLRDPGPRRGPHQPHRGRLPQRRRPSGRRAAGDGAAPPARLRRARRLVRGRGRRLDSAQALGWACSVVRLHRGERAGPAPRGVGWSSAIASGRVGLFGAVCSRSTGPPWSLAAVARACADRGDGGELLGWSTLTTATVVKVDHPNN